MNEFVHFLSHSQFINTSEPRKVTQKVDERVGVEMVMFLKARNQLRNLTKGCPINNHTALPSLSKWKPSSVSQGLSLSIPRQSHELTQYTVVDSQCPVPTDGSQPGKEQSSAICNLE